MNLETREKMNNNIKTIEEFRVEFSRLSSLKKKQEKEFEEKLDQLLISVSPGNLLNEAVQGVIADKHTGKNIALTGIDAVLSVMINRFLYMGKKPGILMSIGTYFLQGFTERFVVEKSGSIIDFVKKIFSKKNKSPKEKETV